MKQDALAWTMLQDICNSGHWMPEYCLYLIQKFEDCHLTMTNERREWLSKMIAIQNGRAKEYKVKYSDFYKLFGGC